MRWLPLLGCLLLAIDPSPSLEIKPENDPRKVKVIATLPKSLLPLIPQGKLSSHQGEKWLQFSLVNEKGEAGPPIFGSYQRTKNLLTFQPRYPLVYEHKYRAILRAGKNANIVAGYQVPAAPATAPTVVSKVYPSADVLPANTLKFYIYFSGPMRGGSDVFDQVYLLDEKGNKIEDSWLKEEFWDETEHRLLLYIHPGRIKWGLLLRQLLGPVFYPNRRYTLVISTKMLDKNGRAIAKEYRKSFRTLEEYRQRVELSQWKIKVPKAGTKQPVQLRIPMPADHVSMKRFVKIVDDRGNPVDGRITIGKGERSWSLHPAEVWEKKSYSLTVDRLFEDVAGNTPARPFDRDLKEEQPPPQPLSISFQPE